MRGALIVPMLLLLLPGAQAMTIETAAPGQAIVPGQAWPLDVTFTVECTDVLLVPSMEPGIVVAFQAPQGIAVSGDEWVPIEREACAVQQVVQATRTYDVVAGMDVEAEMPHTLALSAALDGSDAHASSELALETAFVSIFNATAPWPHKAAGPQKQIEYDVTIENHGNAATKFLFRLVEIDGDGQIILPTEVVLDGVGGQTTSVTATLVFSTPYKNGQNDEHTEFRMVVASASAREGTPGTEQPLAFQADTKGMYVPGVPLAGLAALLLALARRR